MKRLFKITSFFPALFMICMIYSFSSQTGTQSGSFSLELSTKIIHTTNSILGMDWSESQKEDYSHAIHTPLRKLAHMSEYCLLFLFVILPFFVYKKKGSRSIIVAFVITLVLACLDEYHQSFVGGRGPSILDVFIDSIGILFGILLLRFFSFFSKRNQR